MVNILITDVESRKGFDLVSIVQNSLGYKVILAAPKHTNFRLPAIYTQKVYRLNDKEYTSFAEDLTAILDEKGAENVIYIPVSEKYTQLFYRFLEEQPECRLRHLLPKEAHFQLCRNKDQFQLFCEAQALPVPRSYTAESLTHLAANFKPLVFKKKVGAGSVGLKFVNEKEELAIVASLDLEEYLIQEKVDSDGVIFGGFYLCHDGELVAYHGHQRVRTFPEKAGVTVFSKAEDIEELKIIGSAVLRKLNWNGLAMIEFMYDNTSQSWKIIELNPRLWGSVLLTHFCNSKLIDNYINLCSEKTVAGYSINTESYIQWLFPFELLSFLKRKISFGDLAGSGKQVCRINMSYSSGYRSLAYLFYFTFNLNLIRRFFKKLES